MGVAMSHPVSILGGCCNNYKSCGDTKELFEMLDSFEQLSFIDFVISSVILIVLLLKTCITCRVKENDRRQKPGQMCQCAFDDS